MLKYGPPTRTANRSFPTGKRTRRKYNSQRPCAELFLASLLERALKVVHDSANPVLETVAASIHGVGRLGNIPVLAGDTLKDLGLSRLRLLAVLIELEDKFAIEFPTDAIEGFRKVGDITFYIHSREMAAYNPAADERPAAASHPIGPRPSNRDRPLRVCVRVFGRALGLAA
jgi:acyl carrier protein